jgi:hypothetical protein
MLIMQGVEKGIAKPEPYPEYRCQIWENRYLAIAKPLKHSWCDTDRLIDLFWFNVHHSEEIYIDNNIYIYR